MSQKLGCREVDVVQCQERHKASHEQVGTQYEVVPDDVLLVKFSSEKSIHKFVNGARAFSRGGQVSTSAFDSIVEICVEVGNDRSIVPTKHGRDHPFVDVMSRSYPIRDGKKTRHELRSDNQPRKEIVESNEDTGQDLSGCHRFEEANECLSKVGVQGNIKSKKTLPIKEFPVNRVRVPDVLGQEKETVLLTQKAMPPLTDWCVVVKDRKRKTAQNMVDVTKMKPFSAYPSAHANDPEPSMPAV